MNVRPDITVAPEAADDDLWFKDAIVYQLHVKAFADNNNDGVGDFAGLTGKLDYLRDLGVDTLWLLPFYPSPGRDDGYDIADYGDINPRLRHDEGLSPLHARGEAARPACHHRTGHQPHLRPASLVQARQAQRQGTSARDWYVWSDSDQNYQGTRIIFTDTEKSNWAWDPEAQSYYWHRFFSHQPDLNFDNPRVVRALLQVMKRWLDAGVDGFRLDAVPYLCEREGTNNENLPETHAVIKLLRAELDAYAPNKVLLAEANQWPEDVQQYFGQGDECHMAYHFPLMPRIYMAIAQEDRFPITDIMRQTPEIPPNCQWAMFLRNHDELTLEMVTDAERDYLWSTYAADPRARINLGIRRRLAPLMDNDRRKIELMNSILMSMPGTPIIYYGDEIGMGDNIFLGDRNGVRTPMQWTPDRNGGFSRCDPAQLYLPPIMDPVYGFSAVNVEAQARSLSSLLNWMKRLIGVRKSSKVFGRGTLTFIRPANRAVLAYVRQLGDEAILCVANISRAAQAVELDMSAWKGRVPQEMLGRTRFPRIGELPYLVTLPPYGFFWFQLLADEQTEPEKVLPREVTTLVLGHGWENALSSWTRRTFENDVLPSYLPERRWFADKGVRHLAPKVTAAVPIEHGDDRFAVVIADVAGPSGISRYFLPLTIRWARYTSIDGGSAILLAAVRRGPREGALLDASPEREFITALLAKIHAGEDVARDGNRLEFRPTHAFSAQPAPEVTAVNGGEREQSNTTVVVDNKYVVKILRRVTSGIHPEIEIGRFLTDVARFENAPTLLGSLELIEGDRHSALAVVHSFIENQGDAWTVTAAALDRLIDEQRLVAAEAAFDASESAALLTQRIRQIGKRTAEMHLAFACDDKDPAFAPEPITADDVARWNDAVASRAQTAFAAIERRMRDLPEATAELAQRLLHGRAAILAHIAEARDAEAGCLKIRHHGDFHLGQVLIAKEDAYILDFEGEPRRTIEERRQQGARRARRRRLPALDRLCRQRRARARAELEARRARARSRSKCATWSERLGAAYWDAYRETIGGIALWPADEVRQRAFSTCSFWKRRSMKSNTSSAIARPGPRIPIDATLRILKVRGVNVMTTLSPEARDVIAARHSDPFHYLGPHRENDQTIVRVFLPEASQVVALAPDGSERELSRLDPAGLFAGPVASERYRLRARFGEQEVEFEDPYRFPPVLSDFDLYLLGEGNHLRLYDKLGAHPMKMEGIAGVGLRRVGAERAPRQRRRRLQPVGRPPPRHARARQRLVGNFRARRQGRRQIQIRDRRPQRRAATAEVRPLCGLRRDAAIDRLDRRRSDDAAEAEAGAVRTSTRSTGRCRSTKCISARGGAKATMANTGSIIASSPSSSPPTPPTWASPISSCCRSPSIPSTARGATSRPACSRRPAASARRRISSPWSRRSTTRASACCSTGCRDISPTIRTGWPASTAPRSTSTTIRDRAAISTGAR